MTPSELLTEARAVISRGDSALAGSWARVSTLLTRQALEEVLDAFWARGDVEIATLKGATTATQLACLPEFVDPGLAYQTSFVWSALSNACHYHAYDLPPSAAELEDWIADVERVVSATATVVPAWR